MAHTWSQITSPTPRDISDGCLRRSFSYTDLMNRRGMMRRSYSDNSIRASTVQPKLQTNRFVGLFNGQLSDTLKSLLSGLEASRDLKMQENDCYYNHSDDEDEVEICEGKRRANWIETLVELRNTWKGNEDKVESCDDGVDSEGCGGGGGCEVEYEEDHEDGSEVTIDEQTFSSLLVRVSLSDTKLFSQLAFLSNMAYVIPDMKTEDLRRHYGLEFVTSSLEKKKAAAAIRDKIEQDSIGVTSQVASAEVREAENPEKNTRLRSLAAYDIAASAASYVQSRAKNLISISSQPQLKEDGMFFGNEDDKREEDEGSPRIYKSEMAACVAASTMTAVVAAGEKQKEKAAKALQSLHSSPCEWFVCDDSDIYTRCLVIQGSDSLASWQANLFFEPAKFEGTEVLVHRGIYEAAKGIYDQFMPEIKQHLNKNGDRAKLRFTGHSLGGSLALLVNLLLLTRKEVNPSSLLPVVTFGSPFVFCGVHKILEQLGVDENHVHCVMMHRDIVPRAFSCNYPNYVAQILKRMNTTFRSHPCLNKNRLLYSPMGRIFILQPDEKLSPPHPLLPPGSALYGLDNTNSSLAKLAIRAFINSPHPIETLSNPTAYGYEGTIIRDHDSSNYLKVVNEVIRQCTRLVVKKARKQRNQLWPLLTSRSPHAWSHTCTVEGRPQATKKLLTGV